MRQSLRLENRIDPEKYKQIVEGQRAAANLVAQRLLERSPLDDLPLSVLMVAASGLRLWAQSLPDKPPRKTGRPAMFDPGHAALEFAIQTRLCGISGNQAYLALADRYGVEPEAIRQAVRKTRAKSGAVLDQLVPKKPSGVCS